MTPAEQQIRAALSARPTFDRWMHLPGDRFVYTRLEDGCRGVPVVGVEHPQAFFDLPAKNLDYVAACNPANVAELLAELDRLREANETFGKRQTQWTERMFEMEQELGWLRKQANAEAVEYSLAVDEIEKLKRELDRLRAERKPLTDEQMLECVRSVLLPTPTGLTRDRGPYEITEPTYYLQTLVRAVERAHHITGD